MTTTATSGSFLQERLRALVESFYDCQEVRVRLNNRLRQIERDMVKAGVPMDDALLEPLMHEERAEQSIYRMIGEGIKEHPLKRRWRGQKGIGPIAIGGMVAWLDPAEAPHASSFWRFMGLDVQCSVCHESAGTCDHTDAPGVAPRRERGVKTTWSPTARVHAWKVGRSLLMQANEHYRPIYEEFKAQEVRNNVPFSVAVAESDGYRLAEEVNDLKVGVTIKKRPQKDEPKTWDVLQRSGRGAVLVTRTDGHVHNRTMRKVVKLWVEHVWITWREELGLPTGDPYPVAQMGHARRYPPPV